MTALEQVECAVCDLPVDPGDDPHWDADGRAQHPACCVQCRPAPKMDRAKP